jgi:predicted Holliday junction resolvase-like endonuclease
MDLTLVIYTLIFLIGLVLAYIVGLKIGTIKRDRHWETEVPLHRKDAVQRSRAVLSGNFSEQLAPYFPDFPYLPTECKFLGRPIDFIVFKGLDDKNVEEVVFVEVKSGNSKLSKTEKSLKNAIENKKVFYEEYRIPDDVVKKREE